MKRQNNHRHWTDKNGDEHGEWPCEFHPFFKVHVVLFKNGGGGVWLLGRLYGNW